MKRAGIVTIHMINNYGAVAQAYALNKYLRLNGIDATTIDFRTYRVAESYKLFYPMRSAMDVFRNVQVLMFFSKLRRRNRRFHYFLKQYVPMTNCAYFSNQELEQSDLCFDYYICGSDQIWNTYCQNYDDAFILRFARNRGKRLSYAASMGADDINPQMQPQFISELSDYQAISVREKSMINTISKISDKEVTHVMDPVFLLGLDEWSKIATSNLIDKPYIFFHCVKGDIPGMREYVRKLSKKMGLPIVVVNCNLREMRYRNIKCYDAGPTDFISLIKNAEYIVTNSFHVSAFSVIFQKKFVVFNAEENGAERINSLLDLCGLQERQVNQNSDPEGMLNEVDYGKVNKRIKTMIEKSKDFLAKALDYERKC